MAAAPWYGALAARSQALNQRHKLPRYSPQRTNYPTATVDYGTDVPSRPGVNPYQAGGSAWNPEAGGPQPQTKNDNPPYEDPAKSYDYSSDPILQSFDAAALAARRKRESGKQEMIKEILLGLGSQSLAREILGNDPFVDSISDDPSKSTSALAQLGYSFNRNRLGLIENTNNENLFYSGFHADQQGELSRNRLLSEAGLLGNARGQLRGISQQFEEFLDQQRMARVEAEQAAYQRAIEAALASGSSGKTGSGSKKPDETPAAPPAAPPAPPAAPPAGGGGGGGGVKAMSAYGDPYSSDLTLQDLVKKYSRGRRQYLY